MNISLSFCLELKQMFRLPSITILILTFSMFFCASCKKKENVTFQYTYTLNFSLQGNPTSINGNLFTYDVWIAVDNNDFLQTYQDKNINLSEMFLNNAVLKILAPGVGTFDDMFQVTLGYGGERFVVPPVTIGEVLSIPPISLTSLAFVPIASDVRTYARRTEVDFLLRFISSSSSLTSPLSMQAVIIFDVSGKER
ncbi:MAG: hypothetical protein HKN22_02260 [Bacteroidia bacterium]|nr:hypothetical protein [Bacteroidia bacterium]